MNVHEAVKKVLKNEHITQTELAKKMGFKTMGAINNALTRNVSVEKLVNICNALDYDICLVPRSGTEKKERTVVVDGVINGVKRSKKEKDKGEKEG